MSRSITSYLGHHIPSLNFTKKEYQILKEARKFAEDYHRNQEKTGKKYVPAHGFDHVRRVTGNAALLCTLEKESPFLPILCAILHDLGRASEDKRADSKLHGQLSVEIANSFFERIDISNKDRDLVKMAIEDHPFLNKNVRRSFVVKILMDADRLDSLGTLGPLKAAIFHPDYLLIDRDVTRAITKIGSKKSLYFYFDNYVPQWADMLWTGSARKIAAKKLKVLKKFNRDFLHEINFMEDCFSNLKI